jgi:precorrin-2 dehydrogenase/sirohydrochlorin ferrochelatase
MLDVRGRKTIVIGGNRIAAEKATALGMSGADVTMLSDHFDDEAVDLERRNEVKLLHKPYQPGDLEGAFVVVAAVKDPDLIACIWLEAQERNQLVNVVDVPAYCNFIVPSILRRDQLTISVSTEGASPGLAKRIRQRLEGYFPAAYGTYLRLASVVRTYMRDNGVSYGRRDEFFGEFFASDVLRLLARGDEAEALLLTTQLLRRYNLNIADEIISRDLREAV